MKKTYIAPCTLVVNLRLSDSVLDDPGMGRASQVDGGEMDAKEQQLDWDEEATSNLPCDINLWEDTDDTDGY